MRNRQSLLDIIARAEREPLLAGEAAILRDAIEALTDMTDTVNAMCGCSTGQMPVIRPLDGP
jgi:hypothetical protein